MNEENKAFELTDDELEQVSGGNAPATTPDCYTPLPPHTFIEGLTKSTCLGCSYHTKCMNSKTERTSFEHISF